MINLSALNAVKSTKNVTNAKSQNGFRQNLYVQKPDTFERTCPVNFTGSSNKSKQYEKRQKHLKLLDKMLNYL